MATSSDKHRELIQSFVASEEEYLQTLSETVQHFLLPLRLDSGAKILPRDALPLVFLNIELLCEIQKDLLNGLRAACSTGDDDDDSGGSAGSRMRHIEPSRFWPVFLQFVPKLQSYRQYVENFDSAQKVLAKYSGAKAFQKFVEQQKLWKAHLDLNKGLQAPTQHVRNLSLFAARCEKAVALDDPLLPGIGEAVLLINELNAALVAFRSNAEHVLKLRDIAKRIKGLDADFVESGRKVIREGYLEKTNPRGKVQRRWFVLVSDQLIWAAPRGMGKQTMDVKGSLPLNAALVNEGSADSLAFQIVRMDVHKNYHLAADSPAVKERWVSDLKQIVDELLEAGKQEAKSQSASSSSSSSSATAAAGAAAASGSESPQLQKRGSIDGVHRVPARVSSANRLSMMISGRKTAPSTGSRNSGVAPLKPAATLLKLDPPREYPRLDLVDTTVDEAYRARFQLLVAEARGWAGKSNELENKLRSMDRRLKTLEIATSSGHAIV